MNFKFKSNMQIVLSLAVTWIICNLFSMVGFYLEYKSILNITEIFLANTLTGIFSLPEALCDLVVFWDRDFSGTFLFAFAYWICIAYLIRELLKTKKSSYFYLVVLILLLSSFFWSYEAQGMIGI